ncbi:MAG: hypothetical protein GWN55_17295, partial [Phycisphaerae bacterium]|nr:hypothetical protein [candidate division KSB1 bacterium]NIV03046.1 hypothetical protein [Phycisphaerae bacterium]NIS28382.1 hypothetical protein [candidate division KSB1 bacterium]NIT75263.1 hypothetical protein [candidate division KSB1 bacterium]NIU29110.1 hypothetical protein [candidate division KSB1 bacterium]
EVATQQQKLEDFAFSTTYDMVVCTFALHTVSPEAALGFIEDAKNPTAAGGIHVITVITNQGDFCQCTHEHGEQLFYP